MSLKNAQRGEVLPIFSRLTGADLVIDAGIAGAVSAEAGSVPWGRMLGAILRLYDLRLEVDGDRWRIGKRDRAR